MISEYPVYTMLMQLKKDNLLPALLFRTSRRQCDDDIEKLSIRPSAELPLDEQEVLKAEVEKIVEKYSMEREVIFGHLQYEALIKTGAGAHHAGQLLLWRLLLEELMVRGVLRLMIATGTVAAGVDFPARTTVITAHSKRGADGFKILTSSEFQQMSGRAGRRGKDSVGICLVAPGLFSDARVVSDIIKKPVEPLRSAYFAAPSTVLNLLKFRSVEDLRFLVEKSFAGFLDRKEASKLQEELKELQREYEEKKDTLQTEVAKKFRKKINRRQREVELLKNRQSLQLENTVRVLESLGHIKDKKLTPKGHWAAELCTSLVLELAEAIDSGLFEDLDAYELVGLVASIAGDSYRSYINIKKNLIKKQYFDEMTRIVEYVKLAYENKNRDEVVVQPSAAITVTTWMDSQDWSSFASILRLAGVAEGDASRLISQTADHLNQISRLEGVFPSLAAQALEARNILLRPPLLENIAKDLR
ncbi:MAG: hypothetical protein ACOX3T_07795 [Bdellovibrionota bacterium]